MVDEKTADEFNSYMKKFTDMYAHLAQVVKNHSRSPNPLILDLGTGPGLLAVELHRMIPQAAIIGLDPLVKMLSLAQENLQNAGISSFELIQGVSEEIPLKDNTIDLIASRFSLPYWKDPPKSFSEMKRIVKPGGKIILEALNREFPSWKLAAIKFHMLFNKAGTNVAKYHVDAYQLAYSMDQVEHFLTNEDFIIIEKKGKKKEWKFIIVAQKNL